MAVELAVAYVSLVPSAKGIQQKIARELEKPTEKVAQTAGKKAGDKFGQGLSTGLTKTGRTAKGLQGALGGLVATAGGVGEIMRGNVLEGLLQLEGGFGRAALGVAKFAKSVGLAAAEWTISMAKAVAAQAVAVASTVAGWVVMGVQALLGAAKVAAAWVISMGPIALVIAAVAGAAFLIVKHWDTIKRFVTTAARFVVDFLKAKWPLILSILGGPIGLAVTLIIKNWDKIKSVFTTALRFVVSIWTTSWNAVWRALQAVWRTINGFFAGLPGRIVAFFRNAAVWLYNAGLRILTGALNGIKAEWIAVGRWFGGIAARIAGYFNGAALWLYTKGTSVIKGLLKGITDKIGDIKRFFTNLPGKILDWIGIASPPPWSVKAGWFIVEGLLKGLGSHMGDVRRWLGDQVGKLIHIPNIGKDIGGFQGLGRRLAAAFGWTGGQWEALCQLWSGESGWNPSARNPSSGAYGIPQALPPGKMGGAAQASNKNEMSRAAAQIAWGLRYIRGRYGSPINALRMWNARTPHWYAKGAWETQNEYARLHRGEMVLPKTVASVVRGELAGGMPGRRDGPAVTIGEVNVYEPVGLDLLTRRLEFAVTGGRL